MEQFDQLLTCGICLDRYKTPKLLPCQHSYCMDPCMEDLVDYGKRQIKCPECRAEHRIPYNGSVQGFPTNFTLQKFLELHSEITGELPDLNAERIMLRCQVCQEKAYVFSCSHCKKEICSDCKDTHCDILKREISRINSQLKRNFHRIEDCIKHPNKNIENLSARQAFEGIKETNHRLVNLLQKNSGVKHIELLTMELLNLKFNCESIDNCLMESKWDDNELMECKGILFKTMDFIRYYNSGSNDESSTVALNKNLAKSKSKSSHLLVSASSGEDKINSDSKLSSCGQNLKAKHSKRNKSSSDKRSTCILL